MCNNSCQRAQYAPISSKADAMQFAILITLDTNTQGSARVRYDEAKQLFDFITANVTFPEDEQTNIMKGLARTLDSLKNSMKPVDPFAHILARGVTTEDPLEDLKFTRKTPDPKDS